MLSRMILAAVLAPICSGFAQFPSNNPDAVSTQNLVNHPGVSISYKETNICGSNAKSWAGYVHMPTDYLAEIETSEPYNISMFFWYFESQNNPTHAPTAMYLAGGPGNPSADAAVTDAGPCIVLPDSKTTINSQWSWNTYVNMLYIDQPVSTGFSYTTGVKSALDLLFLGSPPTETGIIPFEYYNGSVPSANTTFVYGTMSEQNPQKTANTTLTAAKTLWLFSQAWLEFAELRTDNTRFSVWGNSYGGYYVPVTAAYMVQQNAKISQGVINGTIINVDTAGWTNGCVDILYQGEYWPEQAYNNTYDLQVIPKAAYQEATNNYTKSGGCRDQIVECRKLGDLHDPNFLGISSEANNACIKALSYCYQSVFGAYGALSNRSLFDLGHLNPDPFPPGYTAGYFNQESIQAALGVRTNYTAISLLANNAFTYLTGDAVRTPGMQSVNYLLEHGVQVAMMYGDRDYRCPWNGGEKLSLAANWSAAGEFQVAGYLNVSTNDTYSGGVVRQHGNLSFSRIYEAGHEAQLYQPETLYRLFNRAMFKKDLSTGLVDAGDNYSTHGPSSSFHIKNKLPPLPPWNCNTWYVLGSCTREQYAALVNGTEEIHDYKVVKPAGGSPGSIGSVL